MSTSEKLLLQYIKPWLRETGEPGRNGLVDIEKDLVAKGQTKLIRIVLPNLLGNAGKFTCDSEFPKIEPGVLNPGPSRDFYVKDSAIGFDSQ